MKIPLDLQAGDIFHTNDKHEFEFTEYSTAKDGTKWADTKVYSFLVETGVADPTEIEVIRIQRVNSSGVSDEMKRESDAMIKQERCTKGRIAAELQSILAQYHYSDPAAYYAIEAYKDKLLKEAAES